MQTKITAVRITKNTDTLVDVNVVLNDEIIINGLQLVKDGGERVLVCPVLPDGKPAYDFITSEMTERIRAAVITCM